MKNMKRKFDFELTHNFLEQNFILCPKEIAIETPNLVLTMKNYF